MTRQLFALALFAVAMTVSPSVFAQATATVAESKTGLSIPETDDGLPGEGPIRRSDWFRKLWQSKRTGWAKQVQQDQNALVFLGDSILSLIHI